MKVGITDDVKRRMVSFRAGAPRGLVLRGQRTVPALFGRQIEKQVHLALDAHAVGREWFRLQAKEARSVADPIIALGWQAFRVYAEAFEADAATASPDPTPSSSLWSPVDVDRLNGTLRGLSRAISVLSASGVDVRRGPGLIAMNALTAHFNQACIDHDAALEATREA